MYTSALSMLKWLESAREPLLQGRQLGLEKESLRVTPEGRIAQTQHPLTLGSPLCHPYITTDYSEALMELVTPPVDTTAAALSFLHNTHVEVARQLEEEMLWVTSMPCVVEGDDSIRIAEYGDSNNGRMKHLYRVGLANRYGKAMQVISGVHFNYSYPQILWQAMREHEGSKKSLGDFASEGYMRIIRNIQRYGWVIPYLFGASPAICKTFLNGRDTPLKPFGKHTYHEPYGTSLRLGDIGYTNDTGSTTGFRADFSSLRDYVDSLTQAINTPHPEFSKLGLGPNGEYKQLNGNVLQIENEYYSSVRPKQITEGNEKPTSALRKRGVRYLELRSLDVNAFEPLGVDETQLRFVEMFVLFCLLQDSPPISDAEHAAIDRNMRAVAHEGRKPDLKLEMGGRQRTLPEWGRELCSVLQGFAQVLDAQRGCDAYSRSLAQQLDKFVDPSTTPSARMLCEMAENGEAFFEFALRRSHITKQHFLQNRLDDGLQNKYYTLAQQSLAKQRELEAASQAPFDDFLRDYFAQP